uniref:Protein kinase domain-containing protein n=1 Tax=Aegilops tauschii subsp. strangulata TaxID=200361 RepID=A0A453BYR4_AEGTS
GSAWFSLAALNSSIPYWSSGEWNGHYFGSIPEMSGRQLIDFTFVNNEQEVYFTYTLLDDATIMRFALNNSGQVKILLWVERAQDWVPAHTNPNDHCDVYGICGPFTICDEDKLPYCSCMEGFSIRSPDDWELEDRTGGCMRNAQLDCRINDNTSIGYNGCFVWDDELTNVKQQRCGDIGNNKQATLYLRLADKEVKRLGRNRRRIIIGSAVGASVALFGLLSLFFLLMTRRMCAHRMKNLQGDGGIIMFRYADLQRATKNFSEKLGTGGFGSVFKGVLNDSSAIAVKRLDGARQGEKQFRAEVRSIGTIQHINLVKLIGFCTEGDRRLIVYEHMQNRSLDAHLFHSNATGLKWSIRYQIAIGVARGLAYLHDSCRDCIIHCDIKPENILLDASFAPKIADFGMAKFLGRDFSRVLTTMRGTIGYLAPEWLSGTLITAKVDVYSYGMVLLEIVSGKRNSGTQCTTDDDDVYFPVQVVNKLLQGGAGSLMDSNLHDDVHLDQVERALKVACWCIQDHEFDRPTMGEVVQYLEGFLEVNIPPMPRLLEAIAGSAHSKCKQ